MGTTNRGCVLTGLEIIEGELAYLATISAGPIPYEGHAITTPPMLGYYDGVNGIVLAEDVPALGLSKGDEYPGAFSEANHGSENGKDGIIFIHKLVFAGLPEVPLSDDRGNTLGAYIDIKADKFRSKIENPDRENRLFKLMNLDDAELNAETMEAFAIIHLAYRQINRCQWAGGEQVLEDNFRDKTKFENALLLLKRAHMVQLASTELRRPLISVNWGAQESNPTAQAAIFELAMFIAQDRITQSQH